MDREAVISQQSRRLELLDKGWNTYKPGGRVFCRLEEVVAVEVDHVSAQAWWGVSYGILLQNYGGLWELCWEGFRGYFLWFSEISLREKAAEGEFCGALVIFVVLFERSGCHIGDWGKAV